MKKILFILTLFFLVSCAVEQPEVEIEIQEPIVEEVMEEVEGEEQTAEVPLVKEEDMKVVEKTTENGKTMIEILAVDEQETGCLIKVGDDTAFIEKKESEIVGGIKIFVIEVTKLHAEPDMGICRIII